MKTYTQYLAVILAVLTATQPALAAKIGDDAVTLGRPGSSADKTIRMGAGRVIWSQGDSKLKFSNDAGATVKDLGTGGGGAGGITLLTDTDADFEAAASSNWTASGGSFTKATATPDLLYGAKSGLFNASAGGQTLSNTLVAPAPGMLSGTGQAYCSFKTTATDYKLQVTDGTNVLAERVITASSVATKQGTSDFTFPASGTVRLRIISQSDAADLAIDNCFLGQTDTVSISQSTLVGTLEYPTAASCVWASNVSSYSDYTADTDCLTPNVTGNFQAPPTKVPHAVLNVGPGKYEVSALFTFRAPDHDSNEYNCRLVDDLGGVFHSYRMTGTGASNDVFHAVHLSGVKEYAPANYGQRTFKIQCASNNGGTATKNIYNDSSLGETLKFIAKRYPTESQTVQKFDTVAWRVDANIAGANPNLGTSAITSYTGIEDSALTLTQNPGSIGVQIPCSSTNAPTGATCSAGDESVGVSFSLPSAGAYKACAAFAHRITWDTAGEAASVVFQIIETPNNAQTILQEGKDRISSDITGEVSSSAVASNPMRVCGTFESSSAGVKTLRLMREQGFGALPNSNLIYADAVLSSGQRDIHWTVEPLNQQVPAPLVVNTVTSSSAGIERIERLRMTATCSTLNCTLASSSPGISSVTRSGGGIYDINFVAGTFSGTPTCVLTPGNNSAAYIFSLDAVAHSSTVQRFYVANTGGSLIDGAVNAVCMGPR